MKVKKIIAKLEDVRNEYNLPFEENESNKKIVKALDEAIDAVKENKKLREKNEKLEEKVEKLKEKVEFLRTEIRMNAAHESTKECDEEFEVDYDDEDLEEEY